MLLACTLGPFGYLALGFQLGSTRRRHRHGHPHSLAEWRRCFWRSVRFCHSVGQQHGALAPLRSGPPPRSRSQTRSPYRQTATPLVGLSAAVVIRKRVARRLQTKVINRIKTQKQCDQCINKQGRKPALGFEFAQGDDLGTQDRHREARPTAFLHHVQPAAARPLAAPCHFQGNCCTAEKKTVARSMHLQFNLNKSNRAVKAVVLDIFDL